MATQLLGIDNVLTLGAAFASVKTINSKAASFVGCRTVLRETEIGIPKDRETALSERDALRVPTFRDATERRENRQRTFSERSVDRSSPDLLPNERVERKAFRNGQFISVFVYDRRDNRPTP